MVPLAIGQLATDTCRITYDFGTHRFDIVRSIMRFLKLSFTTTGSALFGLDVLLIGSIWPASLWIGGPASASFAASQFDIRVFGYPIAVLLVMYAMGLYRRDAILNQRKTADRKSVV